MELNWNRVELEQVSPAGKTQLPLNMKHDTNGMEYYHPSAWMSVKVYPIYAPCSQLSCTSRQKVQKDLVSQRTTKVTESSYILCIPTQKHWKVTSRKTVILSLGAILLFSN